MHWLDLEEVEHRMAGVLDETHSSRCEPPSSWVTLDGSLLFLLGPQFPYYS